MLLESQDESNPFINDLALDARCIQNANDDKSKKSDCDLFYSCLKQIPKIGDKNAKLLQNSYKSMWLILFFLN